MGRRVVVGAGPVGGRSGSDGGDADALGVAGESGQIVDVGGGDDRAAGEVGDGDDEGVDGQFGAGGDGAEEASGPDPDGDVDGSDFDPFAAQAGEHGAVGGAAPDDFGQDGGDGGHRPVASAHLGDEGPDPITPHGGALRDGGQRLAVEQQHSAGPPPTRGRCSCGLVPVVDETGGP